ncbi:MAG: toxin-antitoxin system HicB family antitoxin [Rhodoferax sp.]|nr:toxin-antitoxin system HicB family antitoxin [Rhodoferax sp.]
MSKVALRLPDSLHQFAKKMAAQDDASLNQFIVTRNVSMTLLHLAS